MELGLQRQPFVWAALPLYDDQKKIITGSISIDEFHPFRNVSSDDFIYEQLNKEIDVGKVGSLLLPIFPIFQSLISSFFIIFNRKQKLFLETWF